MWSWITAPPSGHAISQNEEQLEVKREDKVGADGTDNRDQDKKATKDENEDIAQTMTFPNKVQLFKMLPKDEHPLLTAACESVKIKRGTPIIKQGGIGSELFVIEDGAPPKKVATLKDGGYFGENALLREEPQATSAANTYISMLKIIQTKFKEPSLNDKSCKPKGCRRRHRRSPAESERTATEY